MGGIVLASAYPGGKVLVETSYDVVNGTIVTGRLVRINSDGSLDASFAGPRATVLAVYMGMGEFLCEKRERTLTATSLSG